MEKEELYGQKDISKEDIERLKQIGYPNFVSETMLSEFDLSKKKILDSGAGPNAGLAQFVEEKGGMYFPLDLRLDVLKEMRSQLPEDTAFHGVVGDVRALPFQDEAFDVTHQRFVLMNIKPETRGQALQEILRVTKEATVLLELDWGALGSTESPEITDRFRELAFAMFAKTTTDPYMGGKFDELLQETQPNAKYSKRNFSRSEDSTHIPELLMILRGMESTTRNIFKDSSLADGFKELSNSLQKTPIKFTPPDIVAVTITK